GHAYPYEGNYSTYLETKAARLKIEGQKDVKRRKLLEDELEWVRSNPRARQAKSRARLQRYEEMAAEADARRKVDFEEIQIPPGPRLGRQVVETRNLAKGFGDRMLIEDLSFSLPQGGIVGIIGPNGVGKTTLMQMIIGDEQPDSGSITVGDTVQISYVDQNRARIDPNKNVWEVISDGETSIRVGKTEIPSRAYVAAFGFKGSDQQKPAGVLSGGERNRVNLALTLKQGGNLLLLDEPTNDLDVETLSSLENALLDFPGCAVITSHDRWFLDRVATHILAWEGGASWFWFEGNFEGYEKNKIERLGPEAARPHRAPHRRLPGGGRGQAEAAGRARRPSAAFGTARGVHPGAEPPDPATRGCGWLISFPSCRGRRTSGYARRRPARPRARRGSGGGQAEVGAAGPTGLVDQAVRGHDEELPPLGVMRWIEPHLVQGGPHVAQPGVPFRLPDDEACMPHAQPRMAAKLVIGARAAPVLHEEQAQVLLGGPPILSPVSRTAFRNGG